MIEQEIWVERINQKLSDFVSSQTSLLQEVSPLLSPFEKFSRDFLSGGKRFRAQCALLGYASVKSELPENLFDIASALEIFHAAALVHDDIMDNSDTRRGNVSVHKGFESIHESSGWVGDSAHFGESAGLLFGDLLLAWSDQIFARGIAVETNLVAAGRARAEFDLMRIEVTAGQYLDIVEENAWPTVDKLESLSRAQQVVLYKSAKYSIEAPLVIGACLAGGSSSQIENLRRIGIPLGIAFQLRDDVLGVYGDPEVTGKPAGDDLREGKRTVLIALAQQQLPLTAIKLMDELLGDPDLSLEQIKTLQATLENTGALNQVEQMILEQVDLAQAVIDSAGFDSDVVEAFVRLSQKVSQRAS